MTAHTKGEETVGQYDDLIARLEKAPWPDRELDFWCWWYGASTESRKANPQPPPEDYAANNIRASDSPRYTASLDAALTLVPEAPHICALKIERNTADFGRLGHAVFCHQYFGHASTPALALCIAALKARAALAQASSPSEDRS